MERRAKIVATLGPASADEKTIRRLLQSGVDVFRLNVSHGQREWHRELIRRIRRIQEEHGGFVAVLVDLMGPRYRLGEVAEGTTVRRGQRTVLGVGPRCDLTLDDPEILRYLRVGERVLIDNGQIEAQVVAKRHRSVELEILVGGPLSTRKGINLPDSDLPFSVSDKDLADIVMAIEEGADYIGASYVGRGRDVELVREVITRNGGETPIVAKLERGRAVDHLEEIVEAADAVMVARGDLGVEVPLHEVPVLQKRIIDAGWSLGKPVIVATQMLESMMDKPRPTRAESSDVANAVFDGADALMLSGETAAGRYPLESVLTMSRIIVEAERHQLEMVRRRSSGQSGVLHDGPYDVEPPARSGVETIPETISAAAVLSSRQLGATRIVALTQGGLTVRMLACRRPSTPVVALTQNRVAAQRLQLVWGVRPLLMTSEVKHHDEVVGAVDARLLAEGLAKPGDRIAILMGDPIQDRPPTNLLRLHRVVRAVQPGPAVRATRKSAAKTLETKNLGKAAGVGEKNSKKPVGAGAPARSAARPPRKTRP